MSIRRAKTKEKKVFGSRSKQKKEKYTIPHSGLFKDLNDLIHKPNKNDLSTENVYIT